MKFITSWLGFAPLAVSRCVRQRPKDNSCKLVLGSSVTENFRMKDCGASTKGESERIGCEAGGWSRHPVASLSNWRGVPAG